MVREKLWSATETRKAGRSSPKARQVPSPGSNKLRGGDEVPARWKHSEGGHGPELPEGKDGRRPRISCTGGLAKCVVLN